MPQPSSTTGAAILQRCDSAVLDMLRYGKRLARLEGARLLSMRHVVAAMLTLDEERLRSVFATHGVDAAVVRRCLEEFVLSTDGVRQASGGPMPLSGRVASLLTTAGRTGTVTPPSLAEALCAGPVGPGASATAALLDACSLR